MLTSLFVKKFGGIIMISTQHYPFTLPDLPYPYNALEPYIDEDTMYFHHDKHFKSYIDGLNKALEPYPQYHTWTLEELLSRLSRLPRELQTSVRNQGGGVYNHDLYFDSLTPNSQNTPAFIIDIFGSEENWKNQMKTKSMNQFGSGFGWLVMDLKGMLQIISLPNQDNPLSIGLYPLLPLDVWEHAYYLQYQNLRGDYIDQWFHIINWNFITLRLRKANGPTL